MARIVIALDGSELSESTIPWVAPIARAFGDDVELVSVHPWDEELWSYAGIDPSAPLARVRSSLSSYLEKVASSNALAGIKVTQTVAAGDVADEVLQAAETGDTRFVALTTRGRGGSLGKDVPGSVALQLTRSLRHPVLVVPPHGIRAELTGIVVGLDGSEDAAAGLPRARAMGEALGIPLHLVEVVGEDAGWGLMEAEHDALVDAMASRAETYLGTLAREGETCAVERGPVLDGLLDYARGHSCQVIVISTHGRSGRAGMDMGSTADAMIRATDRPLFLVPVRGTQAQ